MTPGLGRGVPRSQVVRRGAGHLGLRLGSGHCVHRSSDHSSIIKQFSFQISLKTNYLYIILLPFSREYHGLVIQKGTQIYLLNS